MSQRQALTSVNDWGEYSMVKGFAANGCMDGGEAILEIITEIKWACADIIISYHAKEKAR